MLAGSLVKTQYSDRISFPTRCKLWRERNKSERINLGPSWEWNLGMEPGNGTWEWDLGMEPWTFWILEHAIVLQMFQPQHWNYVHMATKINTCLGLSHWWQLCVLVFCDVVCTCKCKATIPCANMLCNTATVRFYRTRQCNWNIRVLSFEMCSCCLVSL